MKKLFQLAPMIELYNYSKIKIIGPYHIERIEQNCCMFQHECYSVSVVAETVDVEALQQEQILITFKNLQTLHITKMDQHG